MIELSKEQIAEFWHRSYASVDGLWFMKVEEKYGFDIALDIDEEVWTVLPKIQARMIKSMAGLENGIDGLFDGLTTRLSIEGFILETEKAGDGGGFTITLSRCPWHDLMVKSGREALSERIGTLICNIEYSVWVSEFGGGIRFELGDQICAGAASCRLRFDTG
jgi:hypothetical protein